MLINISNNRQLWIVYRTIVSALTLDIALVVSARNVCVYLVYFCSIVCMVASVDGLKPFLATSLFGE